MMLVSTVLIRLNAEYSVVVFPDPVGPVTSTMPYGDSMAPMKSLSALSVKPNLVRSRVRFPWSRIRITIFSPNSVGSDETRNSTVLLFILILMRPSCGTRRSEISRSLMILTREVTAALRRFGSGGIS